MKNKDLIIVQCAQTIEANGGYRVAHFALGVYSNRDNAMLAASKHAIETDKESCLIQWEASGQQGYTAKNTYTLYTRQLDTDCLKAKETA